jgi:hypothetical protein
MLTKADRDGKFKAIESVRKIRIENVRRLMEAYGSTASLARALGVTGAFLTQVAGPNPCRAIGEKLARDIESALKLKHGSLDLAR